MTRIFSKTCIIGGHNLLTLFEWQSNIFTLVLATTLTFQKWQIFIATWDFLLDSAKNRRLADVNAVEESILTLKEFRSEVCGNFVVELEISIGYEYCVYLIFLHCEVLCQSETIAQVLSPLWWIFWQNYSIKISFYLKSLPFF